jgi:hypothetical protein
VPSGQFFPTFALAVPLDLLIPFADGSHSSGKFCEVKCNMLLKVSRCIISGGVHHSLRIENHVFYPTYFKNLLHTFYFLGCKSNDTSRNFNDYNTSDNMYTFCKSKKIKSYKFINISTRMLLNNNNRYHSMYNAKPQHSS